MTLVLEKLGQNPQRSLSIFLRGLGLFIIGICFVFLGYYSQYYWQIVGIAFLAMGAITSAVGYIGMFANRLLNITAKRSQKSIEKKE